MKKFRTIYIAIPVSLLLLTGLLLAWEMRVPANSRTEFLFGRPSLIWSELRGLVVSGELKRHFLVTGFEALVGTVIGTLTGSIIGISLWLSRSLAVTVRPLVFALGNVPIFAFAPMMIVWFGTGIQMKVILAAVSTAFVSFPLAYNGAQRVGRESLELLRSMRASRWETFGKVIVPASLASVFEAARLNIGFGLLGAFIGEFISSDQGLGHLIIKASGVYNVPRVFAVSLAILLLAAIFDVLAVLLERKRHRMMQWLSVPRVMLPWKNPTGG